MPAVFLAALLTLAGAGCGEREGERRPFRRPEQVVLVTIDTLRADHLGCYGDRAAATPVLDALAGESLVYEDTTSAAPITLVSHATIMTGLTPAGHGVRTNGTFRLPQEVETLAEVLSRAGLATGAFVGSFVLHHEFGLDQGFATYDDTMPRGAGGRKFYFQERRAGEVLTRAADWAVSHRADRFFLWAHLFDPHAPYEPPPPFDARFAASPYDGEIAYVDAELGRFFARLREAGILDRAMVIVTSDHGEGLGEHGESTHGLLLYQSTLHVPLIVRPPGGSGGTASGNQGSALRVAEPAGLVDLAPSILSALGVKGGPRMEGRVLPGFPGGPSVERRAGFQSETSADTRGRHAAPPADTPPGATPGSPPDSPPGSRATAAAGGTTGYSFENLMPHFSFGWAGMHGYRQGSLKLVRAVRTEMYDLASDPAEQHDLVAAGKADPRALATRLDEALGASAGLAAKGAENPDLSVEAREKLLALGYVSSASATQPAGETGPDPREMLPFFEGIEKAKELLRGGKGTEGIAQLQRLVAAGPPSVAALGLLGQALMERGELDGAMAALERAKSVDPGDYEIRRRLAEGHYAKGEYARAVEQAREALRLNDRNAESRSVLGAALARLGRQDEAIASFREAIAQRPEEPGLEYNLGLALEGARRPQEAETAYARAVALDPESVPARVALGRLRLARGAIAEARVDLEAAVRLEPDNVTALEQLGIALARAGDGAGALERFDQVVALDPGRAEGHYDRALVLERLGRSQEAAEEYRAFLARWKGDAARRDSVRERLRRLEK